MSESFRTLLVTTRDAPRELLARLCADSDLVLDAVAGPEELIPAITTRTPDLIVIDADCDAPVMAQVCALLKANPATVLLPLLAIASSARPRRAAYEAGADDFLTLGVRRGEFLMRAGTLLRASAQRRRLAAEQLAEQMRRHEDIRAAFRRYLSPNLADRILANPLMPCGAGIEGAQLRMHAAVMFADMRGFTGLSERLPPGQVVDLLNEFFALLTDVAFEYDGNIFSMAGDSLLIGFGVPVEQPDETVRAILAGRAMLDRFTGLAHRWAVQHAVETGLGIGINVGEVIAGNVGSRAYMNYTIIGDTVNVAARLGQRARAGEMLFSDAVKRALDHRGVDVGAMALPSLVLRGRSSPIDIFCVPTAQRMDLRPN